MTTNELDMMLAEHKAERQARKEEQADRLVKTLLAIVIIGLTIVMWRQ